MPAGKPPAGSHVLRVVIAGGGTGGHLYPGLAIADEIRTLRPDSVIEFVGSKGRIEERVVPAHGYSFRTIWISGFRRGVHLSALLFPLKVAVSLVQSCVLLRAARPDVVVGTGGYVSGPVLYVATLLHIPTLVQEQNSIPGVTTRFLGSRVDEVHITYGASRTFLNRNKAIHLTGNPTRSTLDNVPRQQAAESFGLDGSRRTVLVFGGSQGSLGVNRAVLQALPGILSSGTQIIWQVGDTDYERITAEPSVRTALGGGGVRIYRYIDRMGEAYAASDLVICRAGATTLAELTRIGKPSVLIPLPSAAADHQTANARSMEQAGASVMVPEQKAGEELARAVVRLLGDTGALQRMAESARGLGRPDAGRVLAEAVIRLAER